MSDWKEQVRKSADAAEAELKRLIQYLNDDVVPEVRGNSAVVLREAGNALHELAEKLEKK